MTTTLRYYPEAAGSAPIALAWEAAQWFTVPSGATDTAARVRLGLARYTGTHSGAAALKPTTLPNKTAAWQGISDALPARNWSGTWRMVQPCAFIGNAGLRTRIRIVKPDGTNRGVLADVTAANFPTGSTNFTRLNSGVLAPVSAVAGDRLVIEHGFHIGSGLGGSVSFVFHTAAGASDYAYTDGLAVNTSATPWIEFVLDDPPVFVGDDALSAMYLGSDPIDRAFLGTSEVL